jgi:hypothetical protein
VPRLIVPAGLPLSKTAVSCAKGKLFTAVGPLEVVAHAVAFQFCDPPDPFQYTVLAAGNVIPLLPPQSPPRVGEIGAAAPAIVMSRKSQLVADTAAQVRVRVAPIVLERTKPRAIADEPAQVKVPLTV